MIKSILLLLLLTTDLDFGYSQTVDLEKNKALHYSIMQGVSKATFNSLDIDPSPNYSSFELFTAFRATKSVTNFFQIKSGFSLGIRLKRKSYFMNQIAPPGTISRLDEATSKRDRFIVGIPLIFAFKLLKSNISLNAGSTLRIWSGHRKDADLLSSFKEIGMSCGLSAQVSKRFVLNLNYFRGISRLRISQTVINQYLQISIEYPIF